MERKRYYVSVQAGTMLPNQGDASYELEIDATEEDLLKLKEIFENMSDSDDSTFFKAHAVSVPYHHDVENDAYDYYMSELYQMLYKLGTDTTKRHIEKMGILSEK